MKRKVIRIDANTCNGCGQCIPNCPEGAIQMIDGKARLVSDILCDGLGACLGHCPVGAISIEEREAAPYDERTVMLEGIIPHGPNTIRAHLTHLRDHNQREYLQTALAVLAEKGIPNPMAAPGASGQGHAGHAGCPGSRQMQFQRPAAATAAAAGDQPSALGHWPVQMHLISPMAPQYQGADVVLAADCVAFALGDFHSKWLRGKALAIACPKLDSEQDVYLAKLKALIDDAKINTLTVMIMQVPCCGGLLRLAQKAAEMASRKVPIKSVVVSLQGQILREEWA